MEHLLDAVLNGSLSFDGIATAAFLPLIVAGGLALLAFILATLAAFQKRPGQQSAKALPNFGTLWILGIAAIILSTAQTPTAQAEPTHGYREAGCSCSPRRIPGKIIRITQQPYVIHMPDSYEPDCELGYRKSNVRICEATAWDWHYDYLCSFERGYWACCYAVADDCIPYAIFGAAGAAGHSILGNKEIDGSYNWKKIKVTIAMRSLWGAAIGWIGCQYATGYGIPAVNACALTWSERNWNQWDEFCDGLVRERKRVAEEGEFHDCTED